MRVTTDGRRKGEGSYSSSVIKVNLPAVNLALSKYYLDLQAWDNRLPDMQPQWKEVQW